MDSKTLLKNVDSILEAEGVQLDDLSTQEKLQEFVFPGIENAKSTLSSLHKYKPQTGKSIPQKIKSYILMKIRNIVVNTVEAESMRQQKYNDMVYQALLLMHEENQVLRSKISELQKTHAK